MARTLTEAVLSAMDRAPCSDRALAIAAGVPQSTLARIRLGERNATPAVAAAVADALEAWATDCDRAARDLRRHLRRKGAS